MVKKNQSVSQIPWQVVESNTDAAPPLLPFTEPVVPSLILPETVVPSLILPESSTLFGYFSQIVDQSIVEILINRSKQVRTKQIV